MKKTKNLINKLPDGRVEVIFCRPAMFSFMSMLVFGFESSTELIANNKNQWLGYRSSLQSHDYFIRLVFGKDKKSAEKAIAESHAAIEKK
jgi:hypothetical protein